MAQSAAQPAKQTRRRADIGPRPFPLTASERSLKWYLKRTGLTAGFPRQESVRPDEHFEAKYLKVAIIEAIQSLPEPERKVVKACLIDGALISDIAEEYGFTVLKVRNILTAGRARLRRSPILQELFASHRRTFGSRP